MDSRDWGQGKPGGTDEDPNQNFAGFVTFFWSGVSLVGAAALLGLGWALVQWAGNDSLEPIIWNGAELTLESGDGWRSGGAYRLAGGNVAGEAWLLVSPPLEVAPADYAYLRYRIEGLHHGGQIALLWPWTNRETGQNRVLLPWSGDGGHVFRLVSDPKWRGEFNRFAIFINDLGAGPVTVEEVALEPGGFDRRFAAAWTQWTALEPWSQRSINFVSASRIRGNLHLLPAVASIVALAALLYVVLSRWAGHIRYWRGLAFIFFLGWFAMDLVWQRQLLYRLDETRQRHAGKTWIERQLAAPDGGLFWFVRQVKAGLPAKPAVIHLVTDNADDVHRYIRYRSQYHLRPHNVNVNGQVPTLENIRPGDYILVVGSHPRVQFVEDEQTLVWPEQFGIPAKSLLDSPNGALYAVSR